MLFIYFKFSTDSLLFLILPWLLWLYVTLFRKSSFVYYFGFLGIIYKHISGLENDVLGTVEDVVPETNGFEELTEEVATPIGRMFS